MNTLKKLFSLCLAVMLVLSLAVPAMADTQYTIVIDNSASGHTYQAYQIFAGKINEVEAKDNEGNPILGTDGKPVKIATLGIDDWGVGINGAAFLTALKNDDTFKDTATNTNVFAGASSAVDVASIITNWTKGSNNLKHFAELAANNLSNTYTTSTVNNTNQYSFTLNSGYYLFMDVPPEGEATLDYYTELMLEVVQDETITPKGDIPSVTKLVTPDSNLPPKEVYSVTGVQQFIFRLEGDLPTNYDDYSTYVYEFQDYMGAGLKYVSNSVSVMIDHKAPDAVDTTLASNAYTVNYNESANQLTITFNNLKTYATLSSDKVVVTYKATLAPNKANANGTGGYKVGNAKIDSTDPTLANAGNLNRVRLKYSNDPNFENQNRFGITVEDTASVFTYGLTIKKVDSTSNKVLPGAQFVLYRNTVPGSTSNTGSEPNAQAAEVKEYAIFKETGELESWTQDLKKADGTYNATVLTTDSNGLVTVTGLSNGTYHLTELVAPHGYNKLDYDPVVTINPVFSATVPAELTALNYTLNMTQDGSGDPATGIVTIEIANSAGQTLPSTGGMGTTLIYAAGGIMVLLAVVLLVTKKRMHNN